MMALMRRGAGEDSVALRTESRNPSAAASVSLSFSTCSSTPISTGRASSAEAAKATCWIISRKSATFSSIGAFQVRGRQRRELLGVDALDVVGGGAAAHVQRLGAGVERQQHLLRGQRVHQVRECAGRHGGGAMLLDARRDPARDAQLQVGGRELQPALVGGDQDIAQHGQRGARRYRAGDQAEAVGEFLLRDRGFHLLALFVGMMLQYIISQPALHPRRRAAGSADEGRDHQGDQHEDELNAEERGCDVDHDHPAGAPARWRTAWPSASWRTVSAAFWIGIAPQAAGPQHAFRFVRHDDARPAKQADPGRRVQEAGCRSAPWHRTCRAARLVVTVTGTLGATLPRALLDRIAKAPA